VKYPSLLARCVAVDKKEREAMPFAVRALIAAHAVSKPAVDLWHDALGTA